MRIANFSMGFEPTLYSTTTDYNNKFANNKQALSVERQQAQKDRV